MQSLHGHGKLLFYTFFTEVLSNLLSPYKHGTSSFLCDNSSYLPKRAWGGVVVKALRYYSEGPGIDTRWCHWGFFLWHPTIPCARGRLSLLKMSTRILLGVKTAGTFG
jgi:hypothetical protein